MNDTRDAPFARFVELTTAGTALGFRLFALNFALARNFHQSVSIPSHVGAVAGMARDERGQHPLIDVERDDRIGIDLKFGSITFKEEAGGTYAVALVDVMVAAADMAPEADTRLQMNIRPRRRPRDGFHLRADRAVSRPYDQDAARCGRDARSHLGAGARVPPAQGRIAAPD